MGFKKTRPVDLYFRTGGECHLQHPVLISTDATRRI